MRGRNRSWKRAGRNGESFLIVLKARRGHAYLIIRISITFHHFVVRCTSWYVATTHFFPFFLLLPVLLLYPVVYYDAAQLLALPLCPPSALPKQTRVRRRPCACRTTAHRPRGRYHAPAQHADTRPPRDNSNAAIGAAVRSSEEGRPASDGWRAGAEKVDGHGQRRW